MLCILDLILNLNLNFEIDLELACAGEKFDTARVFTRPEKMKYNNNNNTSWSKSFQTYEHEKMLTSVGAIKTAFTRIKV